MKARFAASVILLFGTACINVFDLVGDVKLPVAEIEVPATVSPRGRLTVRLTVVTGGCRDFNRIKSSRSGSVLILEAWGTDRSGNNDVCTADIQYETHEYSTTGPFTDPLVVSAVQPDGSSISKTIRVE